MQKGIPMSTTQPGTRPASAPPTRVLPAQYLTAAPAGSARTASRITPRPRPQQHRLTRYLRSPKGTLTLVFLPLLYIAGTSVGWPLVIPHVLAALAGACLLDVFINLIARRGLIWPSSALLSGLIVAFVLGPIEPHAVTFAVAALATVSKHLLKTRQSHVFNPAALALVLSVPLFGTGQSWWGALANAPAFWLILLLAGGAFILERLNKFPLALSFLGVYFGLFAFAGLVGPASVAEMFRTPFINAALFLACFMLTDPPTSPGKLNDQIWFGGLVAIVAAVAQVVGVGQTYLLVGLLAGNLALAVRRGVDRRSALAAAKTRTVARTRAQALTGESP
jgi:Na+-translocating ferredoxin:NAD+ oxidoreductase RnfD subunit